MKPNIRLMPAEHDKQIWFQFENVSNSTSEQSHVSAASEQQGNPHYSILHYSIVVFYTTILYKYFNQSGKSSKGNLNFEGDFLKSSRGVFSPLFNVMSYPLQVASEREMKSPGTHGQTLNSTWGGSHSSYNISVVLLPWQKLNYNPLWYFDKLASMNPGPSLPGLHNFTLVFLPAPQHLKALDFWWTGPSET